MPGEVKAEAGSLILNGHAWENLHSDGKHGTRFECQVRVIPEYESKSGEMHSANGKITVHAANAVTLLIAIASDFRGGKPEQACSATLNAARAQSYPSLREAHIADYGALYRRVSIDLGQAGGLSKLPIDERRKALAAGGSDPAGYVRCSFNMAAI